MIDDVRTENTFFLVTDDVYCAHTNTQHSDNADDYDDNIDSGLAAECSIE